MWWWRVEMSWKTRRDAGDGVDGKADVDGRMLAVADDLVVVLVYCALPSSLINPR
jgi:hypothetical protein